MSISITAGQFMNPFPTVALTFSQIAQAGRQNVKITLLPLLVLFAAIAIPAVVLEPSPGGAPPFAIVIIAALGTLIVTAWIFVNFHRHVLLGEMFGWLPRIYPGAVGAYVSASLIIVLLTFFAVKMLFRAAVTALFPTFVEIGLSPYTLNALLIAVGAFVGSFSLMLASALPAIATNRPSGAVLLAASSKWLFFLACSAIFTLLWLAYSAVLPLSLVFLLEYMGRAPVLSAVQMILLLLATFLLSCALMVSSMLLSASMLTAIYRTLVPRSER